MYFISPPQILHFLYKDLIWDIKNSGKKIYLTFDDGPEKEVTPSILQILENYNAKATFFCVGQKVQKSPDLIELIKSSGHTVGNHSFSHLPGKKTDYNKFIKDINKCDELLNTTFFRPPYGSITRKQIREIKKRFRIVMWSVLPGDFDENVSVEHCLHRSVRYTKNGTIIVFHDNMKSKEKVLNVLPGYLKHFSELGYTFEALSEEMFY